METVLCEQGHTWTTDGQETLASCPVCGGAPKVSAAVTPPPANTPPPPNAPPPANEDQTLGEGSLIRPQSSDEGTMQLSVEDEESADASDQTLDDQAGAPAVRSGDPETTLGASLTDDDVKKKFPDGLKVLKPYLRLGSQPK